MNTAWFFLGSKPFQQISCHICIKYEYGCDTCSVRAFAIPYFPSMKWKMFNYLYCIKEDFVVLRFAVGESVFQFVFIAFDSRFRSVILLNICSSYCILYNKFSHEVCFNIFFTYFPKFDFKTFFFLLLYWATFVGSINVFKYPVLCRIVRILFIKIAFEQSIFGNPLYAHFTRHIVPFACTVPMRVCTHECMRIKASGS